MRRAVPPTKRCTKCGVVKPRSAFYREAKRGPQVVKPYCKECSVLLRAAWIARMPLPQSKAFWERKEQSDNACRQRRNRRVRAERAERVQLGSTIVRKLRARGMTYAQITAGTGCRIGTLKKYEAGIEGKAPHRRTVERLSAFYAEVLAQDKDRAMREGEDVG